MEDKMEDNYDTTETWYPWQGGGEMIEIPYNPQTGMPLYEDSKLVAVLNK